MATITVSSAHFIHYLREVYPACTMQNNHIAIRVWALLKPLDGSSKVGVDPATGKGERFDCLWGREGAHVQTTKLPEDSEKFTFDRGHLSLIYDLLDEIGSR